MQNAVSGNAENTTFAVASIICILLQISYTLATIENAADQLWQYAHQYRVFAFSGEMGAGKTTLVHALCDRLGVADAVSSPTFALINEYHFEEDGQDRTIFHMDWYRVKNMEEAVNAGMEDALLDSRAISFVEWPERGMELLPRPYVWISIIATGPEERTVGVEIRE